MRSHMLRALTRTYGFFRRLNFRVYHTVINRYALTHTDTQRETSAVQASFPCAFEHQSQDAMMCLTNFQLSCHKQQHFLFTKLTLQLFQFYAFKKGF